MKNKNKTLGEKFFAIGIGTIVGAILTGMLVYYSERNEFIYSFPSVAKLVVVVLICTVSSTVTEAILNTSAREVLIDVCVSIVVSMFSVNSETLSVKSMRSIISIMSIVFVTVSIAAFFSRPIKDDFKRIFDLEVPEELKDKHWL